MCRICETCLPGEGVFSFKGYEGECGGCLSPVKIDYFYGTWIRDAIDARGFLSHVFDFVYVCPNCGTETQVGIRCEGVDGGELFRTKIKDIKGEF